MLKFMKSRSYTYDFVELRPQLLHIIPEENEMRERLKMRRFLKFLTDGGFIEIKSTRGVSIIVEAGKPVKRNDISVIAKLTPKGVELLERNDNSLYSKFGIISAFLISLFSLGYSYIESRSSQQTEMDLLERINNLSTEVKAQKDSLKKMQAINLELKDDIKHIETIIDTKE